jgi:hypothetical protein
MPPVRRAKVIAVRGGTCNAQFEEGYTFTLEGLRLVPQGHDKACCVAFASIVANLGRLKLQNPICVSCPDSGIGAGANVILSFFRRTMDTIRVKPVEIIGTCPAELTLDDEFRIEGMKVRGCGEGAVCFLAVSQISIVPLVWQLQSGERFFGHVSCPGCTADLAQENRVVFLLSHEDKWELSQTISEYLRLCKRHREPEAARQLKEEAIRHQNLGEYAEATQKIKAALKELKRAIG